MRKQRVKTSMSVPEMGKMLGLGKCPNGFAHGFNARR